MSIEIRQLLIKSDIVQRCADGGGDDEGGGPTNAQQDLKDQVLLECRKMILAMMSERGER